MQQEHEGSASATANDHHDDMILFARNGLNEKNDEGGAVYRKHVEIQSTLYDVITREEMKGFAARLVESASHQACTTLPREDMQSDWEWIPKQAAIDRILTAVRACALKSNQQNGGGLLNSHNNPNNSFLARLDDALGQLENPLDKVKEVLYQEGIVVNNNDASLNDDNNALVYVPKDLTQPDGPMGRTLELYKTLYADRPLETQLQIATEVVESCVTFSFQAQNSHDSERRQATNDWVIKRKRDAINQVLDCLDPRYSSLTSIGGGPPTTTTSSSSLDNNEQQQQQQQEEEEEESVSSKGLLLLDERKRCPNCHQVTLWKRKPFSTGATVFFPTCPLCFAKSFETLPHEELAPYLDRLQEDLQHVESVLPPKGRHKLERGYSELRIIKEALEEDDDEEELDLSFLTRAMEEAVAQVEAQMISTPSNDNDNNEPSIPQRLQSLLTDLVGLKKAVLERSDERRVTFLAAAVDTMLQVGETCQKMQTMQQQQEEQQPESLLLLSQIVAEYNAFEEVLDSIPEGKVIERTRIIQAKRRAQKIVVGTTVRSTPPVPTRRQDGPTPVDAPPQVLTTETAIAHLQLAAEEDAPKFMALLKRLMQLIPEGTDVDMVDQQRTLLVDILIQGMNRWPTNPELQVMSSDLLVRVASRSDAHHLAESGVVKVVVTAMEGNPSNEGLQSSCLAILYQLLEFEDIASMVISQELVGTLSRITKSVRDHEGNQGVAFHLLCKLAASSENTKRIMVAGGAMGAILSVMTRRWQARKDCCWALWHLSTVDQQFDLDDDDIRLVVETVKWNADQPNKDSAAIVLGAVGFLANVAVLSPTARDSIGEEHGIEAIVDTMKAFRKLSKVQCQSLMALKHLTSGHRDNQARLSAAKIDQVLSAMHLHHEKEEVQRQALGLLYNVIMSDERIDQFEPSVETTWSAIGEHVIAPQVVLAGLSIIDAVLRDAKRRFRYANFSVDKVGIVVSAMEIHENTVEIQNQACGIIMLLSERLDMHEVLVKRGTVEQVTLAMNRFPHVTEIHRNGFLLLERIADGGQSHVVYHTKRNKDTVMQSLRRHKDDLLICRSGCRLLHMFCGEDDETDTGLPQEDVRLVVECLALHDTDREVASRGCAALSEFSRLHSNVVGGTKAAKAILIAMKLFPQDPNVQIYGCKGISRLAEVNRSVIMNNQGIETVIGSIDAFDSDGEVQSCGLDALDKLLGGEDVNESLSDDIIKSTHLVFDLLHKFRDNHQLQASGLAVISKISNQMAASWAKDDKVIKMVLAASKNFADDDKMHLRTLPILRQLTDPRASWWSFSLTRDVMDACMAPLERNEIGSDVLSSCLDVLESLFPTDSPCWELWTRKTTDCLLRAMKQEQHIHNPLIQKQGCTLLALVCEADKEEIKFIHQEGFGHIMECVATTSVADVQRAGFSVLKHALTTDCNTEEAAAFCKFCLRVIPDIKEPSLVLVEALSALLVLAKIKDPNILDVVQREHQTFRMMVRMLPEGNLEAIRVLKDQVSSALSKGYEFIIKPEPSVISGITSDSQSMNKPEPSVVSETTSDSPSMVMYRNQSFVSRMTSSSQSVSSRAERGVGGVVVKPSDATAETAPTTASDGSSNMTGPSQVKARQQLQPRRNRMPRYGR